MIIKNQSTRQILTNQAKFASSLRDQLFGLLLKSNPRTLIFKTRFGLHTFGLTEPIDIIVLDNRMKVVKIKKNLPPNRFYFWNPKYELIIELPIKTTTKIRLNELIQFQD